MKKKVFSFVLVFVLVVGLFAGLPMDAAAADGALTTVSVKIPGCNATFTLENVVAEYGYLTSEIEPGLKSPPEYTFAFPGTTGRITCDTATELEMCFISTNPFSFDEGFLEVEAGWSYKYDSTKGDVTIVYIPILKDGSLGTGSSYGGDVVSQAVFVFGSPVPYSLASVGYDVPDGLLHPLSELVVAGPVNPNLATRVSGNSRIDTAIETSKKGWTKADNVVLTNGWGFADALAGGPLASMLDAPILLTQGKADIETVVLNRFSELSAKNIYILGGEAVVPASIEQQLKAAGYNVVRLAGNDRYATSVAIAKKMDEIRGSAPEFVFVADGTNYPDALSASTVAGIKKVPIIFTPSDKTGFNATSTEYAQSCGTKSAVMLGGTAVVKPDVETKLKDLGFTTQRVFGQNRYETSAEIYKTYKSVFAGDKALMATGLNFPDALAGGALGGKLKAPMLLVNGTGATSAPIKSAIADLSPDTIYVLGGTGVVTNAVVNNHI